MICFPVTAGRSGDGVARSNSSVAGRRRDVALIAATSDRARLRRRFDEGDARNDDAGTIAQIASRMCELGLLAVRTARARWTSASSATKTARVRFLRLADHAARWPAFPDAAARRANARRRPRPPRDARAVAADLRERILRLHDEFLSDDGAFVDYEGMRSSDAFREYRRAAEALQTVSLNALTNEEKTAFFVNLYNALVVHVTVAVGPPRSGVPGFFDRLSYFDRHAYDVGGAAYTCDDIEHGCLRGTRPGAASLGALLGSRVCRAGRFATALTHAARTHRTTGPARALRAGLRAKSCPPIRLYDARNLDAQLAAAPRRS